MTPPSDLELMMFHDGELDEARQREVEAYLRAEGGAEKTGSAKLAGLGLLSELVIESQTVVQRAQEKQADSVAALVLAKLDEERAFEGSKVPLRESAPTPKLDREVTAANDNGRFIMALAGLAAAAAAALFVWGRSSTPEVPTAAIDPVEAPAEVAPAPVETVAIVPAPTTTASAATPVVEQDSEPSVEVASVDFSAASGAVYYVPSDSAGQTTAVVWLKDE
jgi:hypothetical protein